MDVAAIPLMATDGSRVDLSALAGLSVVYTYPRTGRPEEPDSPEWDAIPGARGCTPQSCGFRDQHQALRELGARVFGLSTQTTDYQREAVSRLHLPFPLVSDAALTFSTAMRLPTFDFDPYPGQSRVHLKRLALAVEAGRIVKVFYPVFPPDENALAVISWLGARR
jgi:peroxiredoxin